ncbi:MAG: tetratricopeptide repeat protein [Pseudomonadales bacterium]|nr:tetratricopeptide repeat protein [Pseudomonadales bacterium]MBO6565088.1 tetratricopeptide repeat protein [Pseudomonadales bacterium]MBO6596528.1 tetratricopeptide repeat protein [Pseudomonadales bacterium]MBO6657592.1 tetratricopeptide repeat protein [Pseudomonadales bacterium]MBO6703223.1 tetratricopeptide repeat protein [Pseudomonadales bacterium]
MKNLLLALLLISGWSSANERLQTALDASQARDFPTAIVQLQDMLAQEADRDVLFHLARVQHQAGAFSDAADTLDTLHEAYPGDADAWYLQALVNLSLVQEVSLFKKVGMAKQTLAAFEEAVKLDPNHINARYGIFAFYANAPSIAGGDLEKARALQPDLHRRDAGFGAMADALLLSKADDLEAAEAAYLDAIRLLDRAGPHFALAQFYLQTEQWDKVLPEIESFHEKEKRWWDPDITVAHLIAARANAQLGREAQARELATLALDMSPTDQIRDLLEETLNEL